MRSNSLPVGRDVTTLVALVAALLAAAAPGQEAAEALPAIRYALSVSQFQFFADSPELQKIRSDPGAVRELLAHWSAVRAPADRIRLLRIITTLPLKAVPYNVPRCDCYRAADAATIQALVGGLVDPGPEVRDLATGMLTDYYTDSLVASYGHEIVAAVQKYGNTDAIRLLGKTHSEEARRLLLDDPRFRKRRERDTDLALAKLGDPQREREFITAFLREADPTKQDHLARELGYLATPGAVAALASQMRTPKRVPFGGNGAIALRAVVVDALEQALPQNELFWGPKMFWSDERYQKIEEWAETVMQVRWDQPRPPYLYCIPNATPALEGE